MLVVQQALQVRSRKRSPHWLKPAHNAVKMQSFHKTGWATLSLDYIGSLIASTTRPAQLCFLHLELPGWKPNLWNGCAHQLPHLSVAPVRQKQFPCPAPHLPTEEQNQWAGPALQTAAGWPAQTRSILLALRQTSPQHSSAAQGMLLSVSLCQSSVWKSPVQVHAQDRVPYPALMLAMPWRSTNLLQGVAQYLSQCHLAWRHLPQTQLLFPPCQSTQELPQSRQEESIFFYFMKQQKRLWDLGRRQVV